MQGVPVLPEQSKPLVELPLDLDLLTPTQQKSVAGNGMHIGVVGSLLIYILSHMLPALFAAWYLMDGLVGGQVGACVAV